MALNWKPVIISLVQHLLDQDITPYCMHNGEERIELAAKDNDALAEEAAEIAAGVDESRLNCYWLDRGRRYTCSLLLVLGNDPDEVVADYSLCSDAAALEYQLEHALFEFGEAWSGKTCPNTKETV